MQLAYLGEEEIYLTKNPEITFFKTIYRRHSHFSMNTVQETFNDVSYGKQIKCKLSKDGDLLTKMGIYFKLSSLNRGRSQKTRHPCLCTCEKCFHSEADDGVATYSYVNSIGHALLEWIEIHIGGKLIDRHYGEWLEIWIELSQTAEKRAGYYEMSGKKDPITFTVDSFTEEMELYIPFNFWFCRNVGLALPVMILQEDVEIFIKIRDFDECWVCNRENVPSPASCIEAYLLADYFYLSLPEREKIYSESHFYLIEQLQVDKYNFAPSHHSVANIDLNFRHPIKEIVWVVQREDVTKKAGGVWREDPSYPKGNDHFNFSISPIPRFSLSQETFSYGKLVFQGADRTCVWPASYFRLWQNYYFHTRIPTTNYIYTYSFSLCPEDHQPTGECHMMSLDSAKLVLKFHRSKESHQRNIKIYAVNYNILMITAGMAFLLFH